MPADAVERALPGRWRRPWRGMGWLHAVSHPNGVVSCQSLRKRLYSLVQLHSKMLRRSASLRKGMASITGLRSS